VSGYRAFAEAGAIVGPLYVALLSGVFLLTWRGVFLVMGATAVAVSLFGLWLRDPGFGVWDEERLRREVREEQRAPADAPAPAEHQLRFFEIVRRLMLIATLRRVLLAYAILGLLLVPL